MLPTAIPDKGRVLTGLSRFWFAETAGIVPNHLLARTRSSSRRRSPPRWRPSTDRTRTPARSPSCAAGSWSAGAPDVLPVEVVVRGYLAGSGWKEYRDRRTVCGLPLPGGPARERPAPGADLHAVDEGGAGRARREHRLRRDGRAHRRLERSADAGELAETIRDQAVKLYRYGAAVAARRGILLADTKFEFGVVPETGELLLIDEVLTPDSSRFWDAATYEPGGAQASFDKQFVRDWLETQPWDKTAPGPALPGDVVDGTRARYVEAFERITGASFERYLEEDVIAP